MAQRTYKRIGHKGADSIVPGNTLESFEAAVEQGVDMIEFDVLRDREGRLIVAHDYEDAKTRRPIDLTEALDAFLEPPLDQVDFDCDLKLPGREPELAGTLAGHGLLDRAMVSTMEVESLLKLRRIEPDLRLGWTIPRTRRDWTAYPLAGPAVLAALAALRRRVPKRVAAHAPELGVQAVWAYRRLISPKLVDAAHQAGVELYVWTVDDAEEIDRLAELGVDGIASNDPRLFDPRARRAAEEEAEAERRNGGEGDRDAGKDGDGKTDGDAKKDGAENGDAGAKTDGEAVEAEKVAEELAEDAEPEKAPR